MVTTQHQFLIVIFNLSFFTKIAYTQLFKNGGVASLSVIFSGKN